MEKWLQLLVLGFFIAQTYAAKGTCTRADRNALLGFKSGFTANFDVFQTWNANIDCCQWAGITCNRLGSVVGLNLQHTYGSQLKRDKFKDFNPVAKYIPQIQSLQLLNLSNVQLFQQFPGEITKLPELRILSLRNTVLSGSIGAEVGNLLKLEYMDLSNNYDLSGEFPRSLCALRNLRYLSMACASTGIGSYGGNISGIIPRCLGTQLIKLQHLDLSNQQLSGKIPGELGMLSSLIYLNLNDNNLGGKIPFELCNLTHLQYFDIGRTTRTAHLRGSIPECFEKLSNLQVLRLYGNGLNGQIPASLGKLPKLCRLELDRNEFQGNIPSSLGNLSELQVLYLDLNANLSGPIPEALGRLHNLQELRLGDSKVSGFLPSSLSNLVSLESISITNLPSLTGYLPDFGRLTKLQTCSIEGTGIRGTIPVSIGKATQLYSLSFARNKLSGAIPSSIGDLYNLTELYLTSNQLDGKIPQVLGRLRSLTRLYLNFNDLSGAIPSEFSNLHKLTILGIASNKLLGSIPAEFGGMINLTQLDLSDNLLSGSIPPSLGKLSSVYILNISNNQLSGQFPLSLCNLPILEVSNNLLTDLDPAGTPAATQKLINLYLSSNNLSGTIPLWLSQQSQLSVLDLSNNNITGSIPWWILTNSLPMLRDVNLSHNYLSLSMPFLPSYNTFDVHANQLTGSINFNFSVDPRILNTQFVYEMDFSENLFTGINVDGLEMPALGPDFFASFTYLSLARNKIEGKLPSFIGNRLSKFETLDLSINRFSGNIPGSFLNLSELKSFNVSNNLLYGKIPQGGILTSFPVSAFSNNKGLCRMPLPQCI